MKSFIALPSSLTPQEYEAYNSIAKGVPIKKAANWLRRVHLNGSNGYGWSPLSTHDFPTVWGGTLDGIRGLFAAGVSPNDPLIKGSIDWLFTQQNVDGGWGSREITYSASEATAWVIIVLREVEFNIVSDQRVAKALTFLESCIGTNGEVATCPLDFDDPRTLPSVLVFQALHGLSPKATSVARYLKDIRDQDTSAWGIKKGGTPNAVSTSMVLLALLKTGELTKKDVIVQRATEFLISEQQPDGSWTNYIDTWFSNSNQRQYYFRCDHYPVNWAIPALLEAGKAVTDLPVAKAVSWLYRQQQESGAWIYDPREGEEHVWCVTNSIVALSKIRSVLLESDIGLMAASAVLFKSPPVLAVLETKGPLDRTIGWIGKNFQPISLVAIAIYIFRDKLGAMISVVLSFLKLQQGSIASNLVSAAMYSGTTALAVWLITWARNRNKNDSDSLSP